MSFARPPGLAHISHRAVRRAVVEIMGIKSLTVYARGTGAMHAEPIAALAALKLASLAVTRDTSLYLALRAALQLRKTAVLPFCPSTHSPRYEFQSRAARD